ncbi:MAG: hypothetical protein GY851_33145 [bacterium]|nr:hypothetical protein [bacterium]
MRAVGAFIALCGLVVTVAMAVELATDSVTVPALLILGPMFLVGGIVMMMRVPSKGHADREGPNA